MNIAIVGASSYIGTHIAERFADGNDMFLLARTTDRLERTSVACRRSGAISVAAIAQDLSQGTSDALAAINGRVIDVVINVASSTSRLRDDEIDGADFERQVSVDLVNPVRLIQQLIATNAGHPLHVIFVSSFLTRVRSPNRSIYSAFKTLQEEYLRRLETERFGVHLTIVRISKVISADCDSTAAAELAKAVWGAYQANRACIYFGVSGLVMLGLYYAQPIVFRAAVWFQRLLRGRRLTA